MDELIGKIIGGYQILSRIGEGGMATVYLARQQSMNRQVALKVLPKQYLKDDTYLQRFEREVNIVSQLEHRHIVPVYDYGEYDGQPYIAMRYMPSGSVDDLIKKQGLLPIEMTLNILSQIASALDYAHNRDVLHRDLKPSNVLIDDDGGAFITDFGIARVLGEQGRAITTHGVVGTPAYMSPEQAQGKELDGRSDVYSLGVMLFEMATGRRPFESETPYSIAVMQVTTPPPSPRKLNPMISPAVEFVILKSLHKQKEYRYPNALALLDALKTAIERPHLITPEPEAPQITIATPQPIPSFQASSSSVSRPALVQSSPYTKSKRRQNPLLSALIGGTIGCGLLGLVLALAFLALSFFLPDTLSNLLDNPTGTASPEIAVSVSPDANASQTPTLDATSETARQTLVARNQTNDSTATVVIRQTQEATRTSGIAPVGLQGTPILNNALRDISGSLIFADIRSEGETMELVSVNLSTWIETQLTQDPDAENSYPIASPDGRWIAYQSNRDGDFEIYIVNSFGGQRRQLTYNTRTDRLPSWSPDGQWILFSSDVNGNENYDLRRISFDGNVEEEVFSNGQRNSHARYSPDGRFIIFTTGADPRNAATWEIARLDTETGETRLLTNNNVRDASPVFSPDGNTILYITYTGTSNAIATMSLNGQSQRILYDTDMNEWAASYSPDGLYISFTAEVDGRDQVFLMTAEGTEAQQITSIGGLYASWIPVRN